MKQLTNEKYVNLIKDQDGYCWAARTGCGNVVMVLPIAEVDGEKHIIFVKEYRPAVQTHIIQLPAGLIDDGETAVEAAVRELAEETGWRAVYIEEYSQGYTSCGLTNEYSFTFVAHAEKTDKAAEQGIEQVFVRLDQVEDFLVKNQGRLCLSSALMAKGYINNIQKN